MLELAPAHCCIDHAPSKPVLATPLPHQPHCWEHDQYSSVLERVKAFVVLRSEFSEIMSEGRRGVKFANLETLVKDLEVNAWFELFLISISCGVVRAATDIYECLRVARDSEVFVLLFLFVLLQLADAGTSQSLSQTSGVLQMGISLRFSDAIKVERSEGFGVLVSGVQSRQLQVPNSRFFHQHHACQSSVGLQDKGCFSYNLCPATQRLTGKRDSDEKKREDALACRWAHLAWAELPLDLQDEFADSFQDEASEGRPKKSRDALVQELSAELETFIASHGRAPLKRDGVEVKFVDIVKQCKSTAVAWSELLVIGNSATQVERCRVRCAIVAKSLGEASDRKGNNDCPEWRVSGAAAMVPPWELRYSPVVGVCSCGVVRAAAGI
eukprot:s1274_g20.t1